MVGIYFDLKDLLAIKSASLILNPLWIITINLHQRYKHIRKSLLVLKVS